MPQSAKNYNPSVEPSTPFRKAGQLWDNRMGNARVQAANWRLAAFLSIGTTFLAIAGLIYQSSKATVVPYIVQIDKLGQVRDVEPAPLQNYIPSRAIIEHFLSRFVTNIRSLPTDPIVMRKQWLEAYKFVTRQGANTLNEYAKEANPFGHIGKDTVAVEISSITPISDKSYQVQWKEEVFDNEGIKLSTARYTGVFSLTFEKPKTEEDIRVNPVGLYIESLHWSKQV